MLAFLRDVLLASLAAIALAALMLGVIVVAANLAAKFVVGQ